jgi:hypothetical protein
MDQETTNRYTLSEMLSLGLEPAVIIRAVVASWDDALDMVDGLRFMLDGVDGVITVDRSRRFDTRVYHKTSAKGRRSVAYQATRARLRDDWDTDLTESDRLVSIVEALGIRHYAALLAESTRTKLPQRFRTDLTTRWRPH